MELLCNIHHENLSKGYLIGIYCFKPFEKVSIINQNFACIIILPDLGSYHCGFFLSTVIPSLSLSSLFSLFLPKLIFCRPFGLTNNYWVVPFWMNGIFLPLHTVLLDGSLFPLFSMKQTCRVATTLIKSFNAIYMHEIKELNTTIYKKNFDSTFQL